MDNSLFIKTTYPDRYKLLKDFALTNRHNMTMTETIMWQALRAKQLGVSFRRQHAIGDFIADFVCISHHLVIEIDGGYHDNPSQIQEDATRTAILSRLGYTVLRYTNEQVYENLEEVLEDIKKHL